MAEILLHQPIQLLVIINSQAKEAILDPNVAASTSITYCPNGPMSRPPT